MRTFRQTIASVVAVCGTCVAAECRAEAPVVYAVAGSTFSDNSVRFAMLEARQQIHSGWTLGAGAAYLNGVDGYDELQLRVAATWVGHAGAWVIENRHLLTLSADVERYRCRLRVVRPVAGSGVSLRVFDELYVDAGSGVVRNNIALGVSAQVGAALSAELYHVWVDNRRARSDNYMLAMITLRL